MKFSQSLSLFLTVAFTIPSTLANFHIIKLVSKVSGNSTLEACPSNQYNCDFFDRGNGTTAYTVDGRTEVAQPVGELPSDGFFYLQPGLCGMIQLNFKKQDNGDWNIYAATDDPSVKGICSPNIGTITSCPGNDVYEELVCTGNICN